MLLAAAVACVLACLLAACSLIDKSNVFQEAKKRTAKSIEKIQKYQLNFPLDFLDFPLVFCPPETSKYLGKIQKIKKIQRFGENGRLGPAGHLRGIFGFFWIFWIFWIFWSFWSFSRLKPKQWSLAAEDYIRESTEFLKERASNQIWDSNIKS